jgi:hypothetical protein
MMNDALIECIFFLLFLFCRRPQVLLSIVKSTVAKTRSRGATVAKANQTATATTAVMDDEEEEGDENE